MRLVRLHRLALALCCGLWTMLTVGCGHCGAQGAVGFGRRALQTAVRAALWAVSQRGAACCDRRCALAAAVTARQGLLRTAASTSALLAGSNARRCKLQRARYCWLRKKTVWLCSLGPVQSCGLDPVRHCRLKSVLR